MKAHSRLFIFLLALISLVSAQDSSGGNGLNPPSTLASSPAASAVAGEPLRTGTPGGLECAGVTADAMKVGAVVFSDRKYTVVESPEALQGMSLLRVPADGSKTLTCTRAGTVWMLTPPPERKKNISQAKALLKQGFKPVALPEFLLFTGDFVTLYQKDCAAGETITFGRWALPLMLGAAADAVAAPAPAPVPAGPPLSGAISPQAVLTAMERAADWQLVNPSKHRRTGWVQGAGYAGIMALAGISKNPQYLDAMLQVGETNQWQLGPSKYNADDHAVGQTYAELYLKHRDPKRLAPLRAQFDDILANPVELATLEMKQKGVHDLWSWCDSLFMAPPAWVRLAAVTGEKKYLDFAVTNWWRTSDYLYDETEHLYFRDSNYFTKREANGAKVFWGRGNGWVMGGLVRVLQYLPVNHPDRARFETQFKDMAAKILTCQQPDGLWRASLLDPASYPLKETSGSGFYTYALAWGVNQGLLERGAYEPAVRKAWAALVGCVAPDGKLTHVQPIGADPRKFSDDATEAYGVGAFLLAGSEVYRLAALEKTSPRVVSVTNPGNFSRACETVEVDLAAPDQSVAVMEGLTSRILDSQVIGNKLLFQVDLAPGETRRYIVLDNGRLPAVPPPTVKTFARFVPERMDDFAWESDRIAYRMYGPALITGEGTISSGVDVWVKSTRNMILNKWYASKKYHNDSGEGLDCYSVSHVKKPTRGCGGLGIWDGEHLFVSRNFSAWKLIATGPVRSVFELTYDAWDAAGRKVSEVKRISIDAGSNFSRAESTFTADGKDTLAIGVGIANRGGDSMTNDLAGGWLAYWEPEQGKNGRTACALVFPNGVKEFTKDDANLLAIAPADPGRPFVYYFGAGWSKSGDFCDSVSWNNYVQEFARRLKSPLVVSDSNLTALPLLSQVVSPAQSDPTENLFQLAAKNAQGANEAFCRSRRYIDGWLAHADPATGLIPRNLKDSRDFWNGRDSAADNYSFMVLTAAMTDRPLLEGRMLDMLHTETKVTCRQDRLPDDYSFSKKGWRRETFDLDATIFDGAEYVKDGLLPITEWLGPSPWSERALGIIDDIWKNAHIETPFGKIPTLNFEVNGDLLQANSRLFWFTGDRKYLDQAIRLGDYYLLGTNHPTRDFTALALADHSCEVINGLSELYAAVSLVAPEKREAYRKPLHEIYDRILQVGINEHGLMYFKINPQTGKILNPALTDNWGYNYDGLYTAYLLDGTTAYRDAVLKVLGNLKEHYTGHPWVGRMDGYADSIEGAITLYNRERVASAADWIDSEIRTMWAMQHPDGVIEGWHGDGNFARTSLMYALWKTQGITIRPWRADVRFGAVQKDGVIHLSLIADQPWEGQLLFDKSRHKLNMHLPLDYPRINQFPEWFTAEAEAGYEIHDLRSGQKTSHSGKSLIDGLAVSLKPGQEVQWTISRMKDK